MKQVRRGLRKYLPELPPFSRRELHRLSGGALDDGKLSYAEFVTLVEAGQAGKGVPAKRGRRRRARAAGLTISGGKVGSVAPSRGQEEEEEADPAGGEESESVGGGSSSVWAGGDESTEAADSAHAHSVVSHGMSAVGGGGGAGSEQAQAPPVPGSAEGSTELALPLPSELRDELAAMQRRGEGGEGAEAEAEAGRRAAAAVGACSMIPRSHAQLCGATSVATSGLGPSARSTSYRS
jgi:hypothetical protein